MLYLNEGVKKIASLIVVLVAIGICLWLINTYVPMAHSINAILNIVVVLATIVLVLKVAGIWGDVVSLWNRLTGNWLTH
ncbi:MAG TPA: Thivi_2564 family membrane protein [Bryobacteraceae bacterium]|nr:Thivi_2564 family membrane protein [Bryobacteraceae bacterium]